MYPRKSKASLGKLGDPGLCHINLQPKSRHRRLGSLGDKVLSLPFFNRIAELYPDHERVVLTNIPVSAKAVPLVSVRGAHLAHRRALAALRPFDLQNPAAWHLHLDAREIAAGERARAAFGGGGRSPRPNPPGLVDCRSAHAIPA